MCWHARAHGRLFSFVGADRCERACVCCPRPPPGDSRPSRARAMRLPTVGVGKSTLLKVIFSELAPLRGYVTRHNSMRMERFTQHHVDQLNMKKSPLEMFRAEWPSDPVQKIRSHLGSMGITGKLALQPIYTVRPAGARPRTARAGNHHRPRKDAVPAPRLGSSRCARGSGTPSHGG